MGAAIIGLHEWFDTPAGRYLLDWELAQFDQAVVDVFGFHALQLGLPRVEALRANRMPHVWRAGGADAAQVAHTADAGGARVSLLSEFAALPFPAQSIDLVAMPHTLEFNVDPHATLREVERVLVPEGRVILSGLNPVSLWGLAQHRRRLWRRMGLGELFLPPEGEFIAHWRLRDWLRLLGFEVESARFGCYRPALRSEKWLNRWRWVEPLGRRWWPILGNAYFIVAVKRVHGMRPLHRPWKSLAPIPGAPVPVAHSRAPVAQAQSQSESHHPHHSHHSHHPHSPVAQSGTHD